MLDYKDEIYINTIVDNYVENRDLRTRQLIINKFSPYFSKYVDILHGESSINIFNADTKKFLHLFIKKEFRNVREPYIQEARQKIHYIRGLFRHYSKEDLRNDIIIIFIEQLDRYKPMIAAHTPHKKRISFTHFMQVHMRFRLWAMINKLRKDAMNNTLDDSYDDGILIENSNLHHIGAWDEPVVIDHEWVVGRTSNEMFSQLSQFERHLLFIKYESSSTGKELSANEIATITGFHHKTVLKRLSEIKIKLDLLRDHDFEDEED